MSDIGEHAWSLENVAAYVVGGLGALEAARLEAHARECLACADALATTRSLDRGLSALFASVRPGPDLEDRVVFRLRTTHSRPLLAGWVKRTVAAAAAVIILGTIGAVVGPAMGRGLPLPGQTASVPPLKTPRSESLVGLLAPAELEGIDNSKSMLSLTNEDLGLAAAPIGEGREFFSDHDGDGIEARLGASPPDTTRGFKAHVSSGEADEKLKKQYASSSQTDLYAFGFGADGSVKSLNDLNGRAWTETTSGRSGATKELKLKPPAAQPYPAQLFKNAGAVTDGTSATVVLSDSTPALLKRFDPTEHKALGATTDNAVKTVTQTVPVTVTKTVTLTSGKPVQEQQKPDDKPAKVEQPDPKPPAPPAVNPEPMRRVIIRSGEIEFEVDSFETASAGVQKLVDGLKDKGAYVATINSEKLANGKVKGSITVRVPPEHLDGLVSALRKELDKNGGLRGVRIGSQDVTKQYYDIESRLKAARTMEQRLLQIIKDGKGDIKALVEAEKELGVWRTKIEEFEGEIRYYANLAALSTLTITLTEKEIRAAASVTERERVQTGVEVEDVEKAYQQVLAAVAEAKGRVSKSEMKQLTAGQFNATINFEVAPEAAGPVRDRLNQLGRVARLEIDRVQQAEGGTTPTDAKTKRGDTVFLIQLYNLANVEPRETATLQVAVENVPAAYQALRDAVAKTTSGRVLVAQLNEQDRQNVTAEFDFEVRRADESNIRGALELAGEVVGRQVTRAAESEKVTDAKVMYKVAILPANRLKPREVITLGVEVADVDAAAASFAVQVKDAGGRQADSKVTREPNGRVIAKVVYEVPYATASRLAEEFKRAGTVRVSQSVRDPQASEGRYATARLEVTLSNAEGIIAEDAGVWKQVRRGLSYSASVLLTSVTWVVFGLCVVLPWALIGYGGYRVVRRSLRNSRTEAPPATPAA